MKIFQHEKRLARAVKFYFYNKCPIEGTCTVDSRFTVPLFTVDLDLPGIIPSPVTLAKYSKFKSTSIGTQAEHSK